ncbi:MAG: hypothetical protein K1060chlam5_00764 [Candidatus Anoxychlamydiales bacterium]|nr:hypothetical protein [Candidatus Anoxychlamydiales bacterium]
MKKYLYLLAIILYPFYSHAQNLSDDGKLEDPDMEALRKWIREKRMITIKELGGDLSLSGEVRVEMQGFNEKKNGIDQRGKNSPTTKPDYALDVEVNIILDYHNDRTWGVVKLEYDNDMGVISGSTGRIALEKGYFGARLIDGETFNLDGEIGRRNLGNVFDSKVQYATLFDGGLLKFNKAWESIGNFYTNVAAFLIDDFYNHYGEIIELGMLHIGNTGFYLKTSFINWKKHYSKSDISDSNEKKAKNLRYDFAISQLILGYQGAIGKDKKYLKVYLGGLVNYFAKRLPFDNTLNNNKYRYAFYVGTSYGRVLKAGDWALDMNFQYVMPQAVPEYDSGGIGLGNATGTGFYTQRTNGTGNLITDRNLAVGRTNYKGFSFEFLYAISNNLTLLQNFQISNKQTNKVGPKMNYKKYEMEFIFAF